MFYADQYLNIEAALADVIPFMRAIKQQAIDADNRFEAQANSDDDDVTQNLTNGLHTLYSDDVLTEGPAEEEEDEEE